MDRCSIKTNHRLSVFMKRIKCFKEHFRMPLPSSTVLYYLGTDTKEQMYSNIAIAGVSNDAMTMEKEGTIQNPDLDSRLGPFDPQINKNRQSYGVKYSIHRLLNRPLQNISFGMSAGSGKYNSLHSI